MKLLVDTPQIFCKGVTHPKTSPDQIYLAYYITLVKPSLDNKTMVRKYVTKRISDVKHHVKKKSRWVPTNTIVELELGDAEAMFINIGLFEHDDGAIYKEMKNKSEVLVNPDEFDWTCIEIPSNLEDWFGWIKSVWKVVVAGFNYFKQDDLINSQSIVVPSLKTSDDSWLGLRELKFKGLGADYRVSFMMMGR